MEIVEIPRERIEEIEPLWSELNSYHYKNSENFKDHFYSFTFAKRSMKLLAMENLAIFAAKINSQLVGYCVASSNGGSGEIDSLYIKPEFQGRTIGHQLTDAAISWLSNLGCDQISVAIVDGNSQAILFYEKFGFKKRFDVLQIKNT